MTAQDCIESCRRSDVMCLEREHYCLEKGSAHVTRRYLALLTDCAELWRVALSSNPELYGFLYSWKILMSGTSEVVLATILGSDTRRR